MRTWPVRPWQVALERVAILPGSVLALLLVPWLLVLACRGLAHIKLNFLAALQGGCLGVEEPPN